MSWYCKYLVIKDKKVILDKSKDSSACFSAYNFSNTDEQIAEFGTRKIQIVLEKKLKKIYGLYATCKYSLEELRKYCNAISKIGFKVKVMEKPDYFYFMLDEKNYKNKTHIRTALDLVRFCYEGSSVRMVDFVLDSNNKSFIKDVGLFEAIQFVATLLYDTNSHIFASYKYSIISLKEFNDFLDNNPKHYQGTNALWMSVSNSVKNDKTALHLEIEKKYEKFKEKKSVTKNKLAKELDLAVKAVKKKKVGVGV